MRSRDPGASPSPLRGEPGHGGDARGERAALRGDVHQQRAYGGAGDGPWARIEGVRRRTGPPVLRRVPVPPRVLEPPAEAVAAV